MLRMILLLPVSITGELAISAAKEVANRTARNRMVFGVGPATLGTSHAQFIKTRDSNSDTRLILRNANLESPSSSRASRFPHSLLEDPPTKGISIGIVGLAYCVTLRLRARIMRVICK